MSDGRHLTSFYNVRSADDIIKKTINVVDDHDYRQILQNQKKYSKGNYMNVINNIKQDE